MKPINSNRLIYFILAIGFIAGIIVIFFTQISYGGADNYSHYKFAHWGWQYPKLLFNHWGKPAFTLLASPFAQFGADGMRIFNLLMGFATAIIIWKIAQILKLKNSPLSILLVLFTPIYFILLFTTLTEVSFSFFLAFGILFFFKKKYIFSALAISLLPLIRTEGIVLFPIFIVAYSLKKQFIAVPLLSVGFWVITILGLPYYTDFWWLITKMPYSGDAKDIYGSGSLFSFINDTRGILGYPIGTLSVIGLFATAFHWIINDKYRLTNTFYLLLLVAGSYILFLSAHSFVWWQGMGNSLGLIRVMAAVSPLAALLALVGIQWLQTWLKQKSQLLTNFITTSLLIWIIVLGINTHLNGFHESKPQQLIGQAAQYLKENSLLNHKIYYFNPRVLAKLELNPFDNTKTTEGIPNKENITKLMPDSSIIVWDAHFGPNQGRIPLDRLINNNDLSILKIIRPIHPFKVLNGYDYAIYIFQKNPKSKEDTLANSSSSFKQYIFDYEDVDIADDSISYSGNSSFLITSEKEYFEFFSYQVSEPYIYPSIKIDFSAALFCKEKENIILVCTFENDKEISDYQVFNLSNLIESGNEWSKVQHTFKIYDLSSAKGKLKLYLWNKSKATYNIDDVKIEITAFDSQKE
jgi:hypothetical protein